MEKAEIDIFTEMIEEVANYRNMLMCVIILCSSGIKGKENRKKFLDDINNDLYAHGLKQLDFEELFNLEKFFDK